MANPDVADLVIDMRYNGGGLLDIVAELGYMIAGASATSGRTAFEVEFNDKHQVVDPFTDEAIKPKLFFNRVLVQSGSLGAALPSLNLSRVFVLTTIDTRSASEVLMNAQQGVDVEVIQIGGTTCGKPCGFYSTDNCGTTYSSVNFRSQANWLKSWSRDRYLWYREIKDIDPHFLALARKRLRIILTR